MNTKKTLILGSLALLSFGHSHAQVPDTKLFEVNFQAVNTVDSPNWTTIGDIEEAGASDHLNLTDGATVNTGSNNFGFNVAPSVADGSGVLGGSTQSFSSNGVAGEIRKYWPQASSNAGNLPRGFTVAMVFKPTFSGVQSTRRFFLQASGGSGSNDSTNTSLNVNNGDGTVSFKLGRGTSQSNPGTEVKTTSSIDWNSDSWYFLAFGWEESDAGGGLTDRTMNLYIREFTDQASTTIYESSMSEDITQFPGYDGTQGFEIGNRISVTEAGQGSYALVQFYNGGFSQANYDSLYSALIPEAEVTGVIFGAMGLLAFAVYRRRNQKNNLNTTM